LDWFFLYLAIALNIMGLSNSQAECDLPDFFFSPLTQGATISPLQSLLLTTTTLQTPASLGQVQKLTDITDRLNADSTVSTETMLAARLRSVLTSTASTNPQAHLWSNIDALNCSNTTNPDSAACTFGKVSLGDMSQVEDPFLAQLPAGYSARIVSQSLPCINSTMTRDRVTEAAFPTNCEAGNGSFYVNYSTSVLTRWENGTQVGPAWSLIACMPSDQKVWPWNYTRQRQDFTENLYLNLSPLKTHPRPTMRHRISGVATSG